MRQRSKLLSRRVDPVSLRDPYPNLPQLCAAPSRFGIGSSSHQPDRLPAPIRIVSIVGTRPNFMKIAPIAHELARSRSEFEHVLIHTGQHYDGQMSSVFLDQLGIQVPEHNLHVGSGTQCEPNGASDGAARASARGPEA